jgi:hypothetical protein
VSQCVSRLGDEAAPLPSTKTLPHIIDGHEIEAFIEIEEVEPQHAANVAGNSTSA